MLRSFFALAALVAAQGCTTDKYNPRQKLAELDAGIPAAQLPPGFRLNLPTAPIVVTKPDTPIQYPDGSYSVYGVWKQKSELMGKEVQVAAYVVELYAPKKPACPPCTPPHLYLADKSRPPEDARRLLVADFTPEQVDKVREGERYRFSGNLQTMSLRGFGRSEGLLSFKSFQAP
jgi:hypothetical protein